MKIIFVLLAPAIFLVASCTYITGKRIKGDGNVITQIRSISGFTSIDAGGSADIYVTQDSVFSVKVEVDNNLQEYIEVYKEGNVLNIHQQNNTNLDATGKIKVYITAPFFEKMNVSGACNIIGQNNITSATTISINVSGAGKVEMSVNAPKVSADMSGACTVILKGETKNFEADGSGSTDIKCFGLMAENTKVDLSGAGDAEVFASVTLDVNVSGAADVRYKGNPSVNQKISGAGSVKKVE
ncbi:MAG: head GIN domain-containing protein [Chitinophagaceae bacterium]